MFNLRFDGYVANGRVTSSKVIDLSSEMNPVREYSSSKSHVIVGMITLFTIPKQNGRAPWCHPFIRKYGCCLEKNRVLKKKIFLAVVLSFPQRCSPSTWELISSAIHKTARRIDSISILQHSHGRRNPQAVAVTTREMFEDICGR